MAWFLKEHLIYLLMKIANIKELKEKIQTYDIIILI